jgi:hypothetical protein
MCSASVQVYYDLYIDTSFLTLFLLSLCHTDEIFCAHMSVTHDAVRLCLVSDLHIIKSVASVINV